MTACDIKIALQKKHEDDFCMCEVSTGRVADGRMDFVAMKKSWAHPRLVAYEIKVNRSDFLNDNK